jgi:hypothetical protein
MASQRGGDAASGAISVLLSNLYLRYVLDLWFEQVVKPRLEGHGATSLLYRFSPLPTESEQQAGGC